MASRSSQNRRNPQSQVTGRQPNVAATRKQSPSRCPILKRPVEFEVKPLSRFFKIILRPGDPVECIYEVDVGGKALSFHGPEKRVCETYFQRVVLFIQGNSKVDVTANKREAAGQRQLFKYRKEIKPSLQDLALKCETLEVQAEYCTFSEELPDLLKFIQFSQLKIKTLVYSDRILKLLEPYEHCRSVDFAMVSNIPGKMSSLTRNIRVPFVTVGAVDMPSFAKHLNRYLEDIRSDKEAKGNIRCITFLTRHYLNKEKLYASGLQCVWERKLPNFSIPLAGQEVTFYTMGVDKGIVIICASTGFYQFLFESDKRPEIILIAIVNYIFPNFPYDLSTEFKNFAVNKNIGEACERIVSTFDFRKKPRSLQ